MYSEHSSWSPVQEQAGEEPVHSYSVFGWMFLVLRLGGHGEAFSKNPGLERGKSSVAHSFLSQAEMLAAQCSRPDSGHVK